MKSKSAWMAVALYIGLLLTLEALSIYGTHIKHNPFYSIPIIGITFPWSAIFGPRIFIVAGVLFNSALIYFLTQFLMGITERQFFAYSFVPVCLLLASLLLEWLGRNGNVFNQVAILYGFAKLISCIFIVSGVGLLVRGRGQGRPVGWIWLGLFINIAPSFSNYVVYRLLLAR